MKASIFFKVFAAASLLLVMTACNKYEEGSNFSLISAKARVSNTWVSSTYTIETALSTITSDNSTLVIEKGGTFTHSGTFIGFPVDESGTWAFNDDKTQLLLTDSSGDITTWTILKLKNKELKITTTDDFTGVITTIDYAGS